MTQDDKLEYEWKARRTAEALESLRRKLIGERSMRVAECVEAYRKMKNETAEPVRMPVLLPAQADE